MSHSSISSSEPLAKRGWERVQWRVGRPRDWWLALLMVAAVVAGTEVFVRVVVLPPGIDPGYWRPAQALRVQRLEQMRATGRGPDLLLIGDSTAEHGLIPSELARALGPDATGLSLATDANGIGVLPYTTEPFLRDWAPEVTVFCNGWGPTRRVPLTSGATSIMGSPVIRRQLGQQRLLERAGLQMMRFLEFAGFWMQGLPDLQPDGFLPLAGMKTPSEELARLAIVVPAESIPIDPERWATVERLAALTAGRGRLLALVIPPRIMRGMNDDDADVKEALRALAARFAPHAVVIDLHHPSWSKYEYYLDESHVNVDGAAVFTAAVRDELAAALARRAAAPPLPQ